MRDVEAERVVVGLPLSLSGGDSAQTRETREFAAKLQRSVSVPVELYDERFTTKLAAAGGWQRVAGLTCGGDLIGRMAEPAD